jgi:hypothetical protein
MNFEDLGRVWQEHETGDFQRRKIENLSTVRGRAERYLSRLYRHAMINFAITLAVLVAGAAAAAAAPRPWLALPGVIILLATLLKSLFRWQALRRSRADSTQPVRQMVEAEVGRLRVLERFWKGAALHFYLPFTVGEILGFEGFRPIGAERGIMTGGFYAVFFLLVVAGIIGNRRAVSHTVRPLREELESWLAGLEAFDYDRKPNAGLQGGTE